MNWKKSKDLTGQQFGELTVKGKSKKVARGRQYYLCQCSCGNTKEIRCDNLLLGIKDCGCVRRNKLIGKRFGRLTVLTIIPSTSKNRVTKYYCKCDCGKELEVTSSNLVSGKTKSCGCLNVETLSKVTSDRFGVVQNTNVFMIASKNIPKNNTSGVKGVSWRSKQKKWCARIVFQGKSYWLGSFDTIEEATQARKIAEEKVYGDFLKWYADTYPEKWEKEEKIKNENKIEKKE